jgi:hypothetical protein
MPSSNQPTTPKTILQSGQHIQPDKSNTQAHAGCCTRNTTQDKCGFIDLWPRPVGAKLHCVYRQSVLASQVPHPLALNDSLKNTTPQAAGPTSQANPIRTNRLASTRRPTGRPVGCSCITHVPYKPTVHFICPIRADYLQFSALSDTYLPGQPIK